MRQCALIACLAAAAAPSLLAQDLYDPATLRTFNITFHDTNWLTLLRQNYSSETEILADLEVDGETYPNVGVRIRGNTSYTALPSGSEKFSLKVSLDAVDPDQELMGYDTLNLNNGFHDPTFCREVVYNNFVARFIPNPRANHALVTLNGQNWGVYINVQQPDKRMLKDYFDDNDGVRIRCPNNPNGPGLTYNGTNASGYSGYEIQNDGGLANPYTALIAVCNAVTNGSLSDLDAIDSVFAIDPSIWSTVLENLLTDDDSYVNKGADFMSYRDPLDGRTHLLQRDANETFTQTTWAATRNFTASNKPVLSHVLSGPTLRQRYMAHYRTAMSDLNWSYFEPLFAAQRELIDAAVQADPKKLYSYTLFQNNFASTVTLPYSGPAGGSLVGIQQFVTQRAAYLATDAELNASGPTIASVLPSDASPDPADDVWITADVSGSGVAGVRLYYRASATEIYHSVAMNDDGLSGDGASGDGVYGALMPVDAHAGQRVWYYVAATASNAYASMSFSPTLAERAPMDVQYTYGAGAGVRITEWMYSGADGEFVELTNTSSAPVDMTGWSLDDDHAIPGAFDLSAFGVVAPGESVVVTETTAATFRAAWAMGDEARIIGDLGVDSGNNYGRNDAIVLFDASGDVADRLDYGDQDHEGTIRTQNATGQTCAESVGQNDVSAWTLSAAGDQFGSYASSGGDVGTPGFYNAPSCNPCAADRTGDGEVNFFDISDFLTDYNAADPSADLTQDGQFNFFDVSAYLALYNAGCP